MEQRKIIELDFSGSNRSVSYSEVAPVTKTTTVKTLDIGGLIIEVRDKKAGSSRQVKKADNTTQVANTRREIPSSSNGQSVSINVPSSSSNKTNNTFAQSNASNGSSTHAAATRPTIDWRDLRSAPVRPKTKPTLEHLSVASKAAKPKPALDHLQGAAGPSTRKESKSESVKKVDPPPVTEEDWEIFKQFMLPQEAAVPPPMIKTNLVTNKEDFCCSICLQYVGKRQGVELKSCLHNFCRLCLVDEIKTNHDKMGQVKCPFPIGCDKIIGDEEVKALLGSDFHQFSLKIMQILNKALHSNEVLAETEKLEALEEMDVNANTEAFDCGICLEEIGVGDGVMLKNCAHKFCKECLIETIKHFDEFEVKCPFSDGANSCEYALQEREIRGLLPTDAFNKHLEKSLKSYMGAAAGTAINCKTPDCTGFIEIADKEVRGFMCQVCSAVNCLGCKVIHQGKNCQQYKDEIDPNAKHRRQDEESENAIKNLVLTNQAMYCPNCGIPVMRIDGCDFVLCTTCKLGICWVTKKPRNPLKKADGMIIDGCHCRENGQRCHPDCTTCH